MYKEYEHWVDIEETTNVQISDKGNVRHSKSLRPYKVTLLKGSTPIFRTGKKGVFKSYSLTKLVYKYFGDGEFPKDRKTYILRKDGNKNNNAIDNLFIGTTRNDTIIEEWQLKLFNEKALTEIRNIIKFRRPFNEVHRIRKRYNIDKSELEQGSLIEVFKNLGKLVEGEPLYNFCLKYVKFTWYKLVKDSENQLGIYKI